MTSAVSTAVPVARPSVGSTSRSASRSAWFCMRVSPTGAQSIRRTICPAVVWPPTRLARMSIASFAKHRRGESRLAHAARDRQPLAGDRLLVDHGCGRRTISPSTGIISPGIDDDLVADLEFARPGWKRCRRRASSRLSGCEIRAVRSIARREPAAVMSRIQSPSLIKPGDQGAGNLIALHRCEAPIASVSRKSTLRRLSFFHTR